MTTNEMNIKANAYFDLMDQIEALQAEAEAIKDSLKAVMVDQATEELEGNGWRATWHNTNNSRFDSKRFKAQHGDLYAQFQKPQTCKRFLFGAVDRRTPERRW